MTVTAGNSGTSDSVLATITAAAVIRSTGVSTWMPLGTATVTIVAGGETDVVFTNLPTDGSVTHLFASIADPILDPPSSAAQDLMSFTAATPFDPSFMPERKTRQVACRALSDGAPLHLTGTTLTSGANGFLIPVLAYRKAALTANLIARSASGDKIVLKDMINLPSPRDFQDKIFLISAGEIVFLLKNSKGQNSSADPSVSHVSLSDDGIQGTADGDLIRVEFREPSSIEADFDDYIVELIFR